MSYVVDSTVQIDYLRGNREAVSFLRQLAIEGAKLYASEISRAEVLAGTRESEKGATFRSFDLYEWVPVDRGISEKAGEYARTYRDRHPGISLDDLLIAATAHSIEAQILTLNIKDFPMVEGLGRPY